jgi:hypothetical protein
MKKLFLIAAIVLAALQMSAVDVDLAHATATAKRFINVKATAKALHNTSTNSLKLIHTEVNSSNAIQAAYYIFNYDHGFIIVSGDDRSKAILAYGDQPVDMAMMPANMRYWLSCYKRQLEYLQTHPDLHVTLPATGSTLRAGQSVDPLITANWSQNSPYWNECPAFGTDTCFTGCPATSLAMVFHYWKYPRQQTPAAPSYLLPQYGVVLPELPPTVFDWDNMIDNYVGFDYTPEQATAVAHLMRYIGQVEEMDYTISGSGAYLNDILRAVKFFEYDQNAQMLYKSDELGYQNYSDSQWATLIQNELTAGRPIVYCAYDNTTGSGHAFNVDGYDAAGDVYHINWGWNGRGNGHFALNAFSYQGYTFGTGQQMIIGIQPPEDYQRPRLQVYPNVIEMQSYINRTTTATFSLKGTNIPGDVTLTLNDSDGVFSIDAANVTQAVAEGGTAITVTYAPTVVGFNTATITCTCEGTDPVTITLHGTAPLEVYPLQMLPADENRVTLTSFRADWRDQTPAGNVDSYTLDVQAKPAYSLLVEADFSELPEMAPANQASHAADYLPEGWTFNGSEFNLEGGCVSMRRNGTITTDELNLRGYDKMTIEITARAYGFYGDGSELYVTTSAGTQELVFMYAFETKTIVVDCAESERVVFKAGYYPMIKDIKIYAGDATQAASLRATESGDATWRLIEGISGQSYTVRDLTAGGTFLYRVKALYIDGTESEWSNVEMVTLAEGGHTYEAGDVNHDETVNITDVTLLISSIMQNVMDICPICADMNDEGNINITDITMLINAVLGAD